MDFGGPDGSRLPALTRIVAYHDNVDIYIKGFAFFYADGTSASYGVTGITITASHRTSCLEQSLAVDGPGGERVVDVRYTEIPPGRKGAGATVRVSAFKFRGQHSKFTGGGADGSA